LKSIRIEFLKAILKPGLVVPSWNPNYSRSIGNRIMNLRKTPAMLVRFNLKNKKNTDMSSVVE
jgi:hypothetical protein